MKFGVAPKNFARAIMVFSTLIFGLELWTSVVNEPRLPVLEATPAAMLLLLFSSLSVLAIRLPGSVSPQLAWLVVVILYAVTIPLVVSYVLHFDSQWIEWYRNVWMASNLFFLGFYTFMNEK